MGEACLPAVGDGTLSKRILPLQRRKSCEVGIGRAEHAAMLDGQRGQVGVRHQIAPCPAVREHLLKNHPVPLRGLNEAGARLVHPALHSCHGLGEREAMVKDAGISGDANIRGNHNPAHAVPETPWGWRTPRPSAI